MRMNLVWSDKLTEQLAGMADLDAIAPEMLTAAAPIATDALKQRVRQHRSGRADKHLADSVRAGKPKKRKKGGYGLEVSFSGYDTGHGSSPKYKDKTAQMQKAVSLEYGSAKQAAQPFLDQAASSCENAVSAAMQDVLRRKGKL